jgi:DNA-binding NarL/FixJ family response regulator
MSKKAEQARARVFIVDDHPTVREGLVWRIGMEGDLEVCGQADDLPSALAQIDAAQPDVAIVDVSLKTGNGIDLVKRLRAHRQTVPILVWSMYPDSLYAERALRAGAQGYVNKSQPTAEVLGALRDVLAGKIYLSSDSTNRLLTRMVAGKRIERSTVEQLSDRELEAFGLMGHGQTTEQIAAKMRISAKTVETYRARIKEKLGLDNATELVQHATQWVLQNSLSAAGEPGQRTDSR